MNRQLKYFGCYWLTSGNYAENLQLMAFADSTVKSVQIGVI